MPLQWSFGMENRQVNRSKLTLATAIVLAAGLLACAPFPVEGRYSWESQTDFSKFKTFAFVKVTEDIFSTPESTSRFRTEIASALAAKGFTEDPENPDFLIVAAPVSTYREVYLVAGGVAIPKAMLRVSFVRPAGGINIYEGAAYAYYEHTWSQKDKNLIVDEAVRVILAKFPPSK
jgi:hypothetical protein